MHNIRHGSYLSVKYVKQHGDGSVVSKRLFSWIVLFILIMGAQTGLSHAVIISPDLRRALQSAGTSEYVSVIINLADKVDANKISSPRKAQRRYELVSALKYKAKTTQKSLTALLKDMGANKIISLWATNSIAATLPVSAIGDLMVLPGIESIGPDAVIQAPALVRTSITTEWNIGGINAPILWAAGITGSGIVVANLDTGVDVTHPDLQPKWRGGSCAAPPNCDSWYDPYTNSTQPYDNAGISTGHGTGTMGIMVGGSATDAYGVAPGAQWVAAKIFNDTGNTNISTIILALQWVLAPGGNSANAPDVVNNSWGFDSSPNVCQSPTGLQTAIQNVGAAGISMVFSAGNNGPSPSTSVSPANYPGSFSVGATDSGNAIYLLSGRGPSACDGGIFPDVVAPGVSIKTAAPSGAYQTVSGTSFSAPHAAATEALLLSAFPTLTQAQLGTALEQTASNISSVSVPNITYGYGLIDAGRALSYLTTHGEISLPEIAGYPASFDYGTVTTSSPSISQLFTVTNRGAGSLTVNSVTIAGLNAFELSIYANTCDGNTLAPMASCTFVVEPTTIGPKSAQININYGYPAVTYTVPLSGNVTAPVARAQGAIVIATYSLIQTAYNNCTSGDAVRMQAATYYESPDLNSPSNIVISLEGGYDPAFGSQAGYTTIRGTLTIGNGTAAVGNLILQ